MAEDAPIAVVEREPIAPVLAHPEQRRARVELGSDAAQYGRAADALLAAGSQGNTLAAYYGRVKPVLRRAAADCGRIREANFRAMDNDRLAGAPQGSPSDRGSRRDLGRSFGDFSP